MKVLLDECVPRRFCGLLEGVECTTAGKMGWSGITNGNLLRLAEAEFDAFITVDRNLSFQQPATAFNLTILVLKADDNQLSTLAPLAPEVIVRHLDTQKGAVVVIDLESIPS